MTHGTIRGEPRGGVIRVRRLVEILHVARRAIGWRAIETSVDVALRALQSCVRSSQGEAGECRMIELCAGPGHRRVALLTSTRES